MMQDIRMRFEMAVNGSSQQQQSIPPATHQTTIFGPNNNNVNPNNISPFSQRPMNLYTKTNHNGVLINSSNLIANQNNNLLLDNKDVLPVAKKDHHLVDNHSSSGGGNNSDDMNSNLIKLKAIANNFTPNSPNSSEEDNSPTEMNNCRRMMDKPPLVKRITMGLLMKTAEDSRPLVYNTHNHSTAAGLMAATMSLNNNANNNCNNSGYNNNNISSSLANAAKSSGYVNEAICDRDRVTNKFGDSCRQSLMAIHQLDNNQNHEFNFKKNLLRETSSANTSPKIFPNSFKVRDHLTPQEQQELKGAAWFQAGIPREISLEVLSKQNPGAFIVRQSSSKPGCFALSLRVPPPSPKVAHYLILRTPRGYKIKGFTKEYSSLRALITHHSVMPELLPVPLALPRPTNVVAHPRERELDDLDSYSSLTDFRKMMADLNI